MDKPEIVLEWFCKGNKDIKDAEFLFKHNRSLETVTFHIQQAAEKYRVPSIPAPQNFYAKN